MTYFRRYAVPAASSASLVFVIALATLDLGLIVYIACAIGRMCR